MTRKRNILSADTEKVLTVWIEERTGHNIPLSQRLIRAKPWPLQFCEDREARKLQKKSVKLAEAGSWGLRTDVVSITQKCRWRARYPGDLAKIVMKLARLNDRFAVWMKQPFIGRRCQLGHASYRGEVDAWLQSFRGQADSLFRCSCSWWLSWG